MHYTSEEGEVKSSTRGIFYERGRENYNCGRVIIGGEKEKGF